MYQVYRDAKDLNDKGVVIRLVTVGRTVLTWSLDIESLRCIDYSSTTGSSGWLRVWDCTVRRWFESFRTHIW